MIAVRQNHVLYAVGLCILLLFLGGTLHQVRKMPIECSALETKEQRAFCKKMTSAQAKQIQGMKLRVMPVGDSVTLSPLGKNAYREDLVRMLWADNEVEMVGESYWGTMKEEKYNRVEAFMGRNMDQTITALRTSVPKWQPNVVLIHIGTNEVLGNHPDELATMAGKLDVMLDIIREQAPDAVTVVAQVIPCAFRIENVERWNAELYERVALRAASTKQKVLTVDMYTGWPDDGLADVAHPNDRGYKVMAQRFFAAMEVANGLGWVKTTNFVTPPPPGKDAEEQNTAANAPDPDIPHSDETADPDIPHSDTSADPDIPHSGASGPDGISEPV